MQSPLALEVSILFSTLQVYITDNNKNVSYQTALLNSKF